MSSNHTLQQAAADESYFSFNSCSGGSVSH